MKSCKRNLIRWGSLFLLHTCLFFGELRASSQDALEVFCQELNKLLLERGILKGDILDWNALLAEVDNDIFSFPLIKKLREGGYPVGLYLLDKKENIVKIPLFLTRWENKIVVVKNQQGKFHFLSTYDYPEGIKVNKFIQKWEEPLIISPFVTNIWMSLDRKDRRKSGQIYIIYIYHSVPFEVLRNEIQYVFQEDKDKKIIYIDELGLIPKDTIESYSRRNNVSEQEAFIAIKNSLKKETDGIEKGIPIYDSYPTYNALYKFLAREKTRCILEDLQYDNWKNIVSFDKMYFDFLARTAFINGDVDNYLKFQKLYIFGFWRFNVKDRDENFITQVKNIYQKDKNANILIIRGIGHFGLEEKLLEENLKVKFILLGEGLLEDALTNQQIIQVYLTQKINLSANTRLYKLLLESEIQDSVRDYLIRNGMRDVLSATLRTKNMLNKLSIEDFVRILNDIKTTTSKEEFSSFEKISNFIYKWIKEKIAK